MYIQTSRGLGQLAASYLDDTSINGVGEYVFGQPPSTSACPSRLLSRFKCVPHQHEPRTCADGKSFPPRTMTRSAMNPGFIRADNSLEYDTVLDSYLRTLLLDTPKYATMLADKSKEKRWATPGDRVRVGLADLTGDKICRPGFADWGSTFPIISGSTIKIAMLYAAHQLILDLDQMASPSGLRTAAELKKRALSEVWSHMLCPPDLDWLVEFDQTGPTVRAKFSKNLSKHLTLMVDAQFSNSSVGSANELIIRLGFEYINSVMWQSGLRHSEKAGLWVRNSYQQTKILPKLDRKCHYKIPEGKVERVVWYDDPTEDPGFRLTALSVVTFFTLLAQRRLVNKDASEKMEALLKKGCRYPLNQFAPIPGMQIRATKCGLTSDVMHVAMLRESTTGSRRYRYALAVLVLRNNEPKAKTMSFLHSFVKDMDKLIRENNR